jgi:uncharacterized protein (DUF58 family)
MKRYLRGLLAQWVRRRQGEDRLPLTLQRRRLYIVPTRAGAGFGLLLFLMLVAGLNYANSAALFLVFLLAGFALVAMHQCHTNLLGTTLSCATAQPTFAQRSGLLSLTFENSGSSDRYGIAAGVADEAVIAADLKAADRQRIDLSVSAPKRGLLRIERLRITSTHPFGLFRTWTWVHASLEMIVYPRPHGSLPMPADSGNKWGARSRTNVGTDEWRSLRPFRDGDSPRQVDWKAYARGAPLLVKEYSASGSELRMFEFDRLAQMPLETKLEQLAKWIVDADTGGERYGLVLPDTEIAPDSGPEHRHRCLTALALYALEDSNRGDTRAH